MSQKYRFGFTQKHIDLLNKIMNGTAVTFITHSTPEVIERSWARLPTDCGRPLTKDDEWVTYTDGAHKLKAVIALQSTGCSEAEACSKAGFA
jgi:hypothetical protein